LRPTKEIDMANNMNYFEIGTPDPEASKAFYGALFDWRFGEPSMPARYTMIDENRGGLWGTSHMGAENWAILYVEVDDVHAAVDRAQQLGATVAVPVIDNGMIEFAHLADPLGNRFGIWQRKDAQ
jgi:predicted enzyme related to lactoylglutathione lyase